MVEAGWGERKTNSDVNCYILNVTGLYSPVYIFYRVQKKYWTIVKYEKLWPKDQHLHTSSVWQFANWSHSLPHLPGVFLLFFFHCNMFIQYQHLTSTVYSGHSSFLLQEISDIVLSIQFIANVYINSANLARTFPSSASPLHRLDMCWVMPFSVIRFRVRRFGL